MLNGVINGANFFNDRPRVTRRTNLNLRENLATAVSTGNNENNRNRDVVEISQEAQDALGAGEYVIPANPAAKMAVLAEWRADDMENARRMAEEEAERNKRMQIAFEIAARISRGGTVPPGDEKFLMEVSPGLFMMAMSTRVENPDAEKYDAIAPEEDKAVPTPVVSSEVSSPVSSSVPLSS